jgi:hypothetical protein
MAWWWAIVFLIIGACFGAVVMGVCAYDNVKNNRKWWEDDE